MILRRATPLAAGLQALRGSAMSGKSRILRMLTDEFRRWEALLATLTEEQITAPRPPAGRSIKDVIAHLRAWQQVSIARLDAARRNTEPVLPGWLAGRDPEAEDEVERFNARIYEASRALTWPQVHQEWRAGFLRFLRLGEELSEGDLVDTGKYPWLKGYALFDVLQGSYAHHHHDHLQPLLARLGSTGGGPARSTPPA